MKKITTITLALLLVAALVAGCAPTPAPAPAPAPVEPAAPTAAPAAPPAAPAENITPIEIAFAIHTNAGTNENLSLERFKQLVEERSGGRLIVNLYPGAVLGTELENLEQVKTGEVQMSIFGDNLTSQYCPELDPTVVPFIFRSVDDVYAYWNGSGGEKIKAACIERGNQYVVSLQARGARMLTASKEITSPDQLKGLKLRVPEIASWVTVWKSLGAMPTPIAWSETYSALQTGVADGQENPIENIAVNAIYEVNPYIMLTSHLFNVFHWTINKDFYDGLDADLQAIIMDTAAECCAWGDANQKTAEQTRIDEMVGKGAKIIEVDRQVFITAAMAGVEQVAPTWDPEVWKMVQDYLAK